MKRFKKILFATPHHLSIDDSSVGRTIDLARQNDARLTFVAALNERLVKPKPQEELVVQSAKIVLNDLVTSTRKQKVNAEDRLVYGVEFIELIHLMQKEDFDRVVMGTVCRTGVDGFLIGNTAERILEQIQCSVLTVKPEGFVCPIQ